MRRFVALLAAALLAAALVGMTSVVVPPVASASDSRTSTAANISARLPTPPADVPAQPRRPTATER